MPIDTDSEAWESGLREDRLSVNIPHRLLLNNPGKAYTVEEITEWVLEEYPGLIPRPIRETDNEEGAITLVAAVLDRLDRRQFVTMKVVEKDGEEEIYYKNSEGEPLYPNVRLNQEVPQRFKEVEAEISETNDRISDLEYEVRAENGSTW